MNRRHFLYSAAVAGASLAQTLRAEPSSKMGIASTSFGLGAPPQPGRPRGRDAYEFLEKCHALGAGGIQTNMNGDIPKLRARAEQLGMWLEGMVSIPRNGDTTGFERTLADAKAAGATVLRTALLGGRRYESFPTLADWTKWVEESHKALRLVIPI